MQIFLGPWQWVAERDFGPEGGYFAPPQGVRSALELGPENIVAGVTPCVFLVADGVRFPSEYRTLSDDSLSRDALEEFGRRPQGSTLTEWLVDLLRSGDPDGLDRCRPAMPSVSGHLRLFLGQLAHEEQFRFGHHPHTNQVQAVLQRKFRRYIEYELARTGKATHSERILDYWCDKYRIGKDSVSDWGMLVPQDLRSEIEGPKRHATTITESFNKADGAGWGPDLTWTQRSGTLTTTSNRGTWSSTGNTQAETGPLDGDDHYAELVITAKTFNTGNGHGAICRASGTSSLNQYLYRILGSSSIQTQLFRWVSGSAATIGTLNATVDVPSLLRVTADGDQIGISYDSGTYTDTITNTAVTSGVVVGMRANDNGPTGSVDNFEAADLAAPPTDDRDVSGALTLPALVLSGAVDTTVPQYETTAALELPALTLSAAVTTATPDAEAAGSLTLPPLTLSSAVEATPPEFDVAGTLTLGALTLAGSVDTAVPEYDVSGTLALAPLTISAEVESTLPDGAVVGSLALPSITLSATVEAEVPEFEASGTLVLPALTLSGTVVVGVAPVPPAEPGSVPYQYWWWIGQGGGVFAAEATGRAFGATSAMRQRQVDSRMLSRYQAIQSVRGGS